MLQRLLSVGAVLQLLVGWAVSVLGGMVRQAAPICNANLQHTYATPIRVCASVSVLRAIVMSMCCSAVCPFGVCFSACLADVCRK